MENVINNYLCSFDNPFYHCFQFYNAFELLLSSTKFSSHPVISSWLSVPNSSLLNYHYFHSYKVVTSFKQDVFTLWLSPNHVFELNIHLHVKQNCSNKTKNHFSSIFVSCLSPNIDVTCSTLSSNVFNALLMKLLCLMATRQSGTKKSQRPDP